jgi:CRISPR-associated protein Csb1
VNVLEQLRTGLSDQAVAGRPAGIDVRQELAPAGGAPVSPPSYEGPLEIHERHVDGATRRVIELDSVGSSANRLEEAYKADYNGGVYPLPVSETRIEADGQRFVITTLDAPHRLFDAWIRLSVEPGTTTKFEDTERGRALSLAHGGALDPVLEASTHDLLLGVWDSHRTGPSGQVRIARSFTSTVLGLDPLEVGSVAARRDPLNLGEAKHIKAPKGMKLSEQGLSSIPPQRRRPAVSITAARFVGFLSFASLRRLRFERYDNVDVRVLLAALCLHGLVARAQAGWSLRSECELVPTDDMRFALIRNGAQDPAALELTLEDTRTLLDEASSRAGVVDRGLRLEGGPHLTPLVEKAILQAHASDHG